MLTINSSNSIFRLRVTGLLSTSGKSASEITSEISFSKPKESFNPHMTLINSKNKDYEKGVLRLAPSYRPIADTFILCQGRADEVGQVTEVLYRQEAIKRNSCSAC